LIVGLYVGLDVGFRDGLGVGFRVRIAVSFFVGTGVGFQVGCLRYMGAGVDEGDSVGHLPAVKLRTPFALAWHRLP
jgi:hypothetical protein